MTPISMPAALFLFGCLLVPRSQDRGSDSPAPSEATRDLGERIGALAPDLLDRHGEAGLAVALVERGRVAWVGSFGLADRKAKRAVEETTVFQIGSISKCLTAWGVMKLVENGRIALDQPVDRYLSIFKASGGEFDASGVTVRRLLSHTAGLSVSGYEGFASDDPSRFALPSIVDSLTGKRVSRGGEGGVKLTSRPGSEWRYSGGGYSVLQAMIEEVTKTPFQEFMKSNVFDPLGMNRTRFGFSDAVSAGVATPYVGQDAVRHHLFAELAAAGGYSTVRDLARLACAGVEHPGGALGAGVLRPETVRAMFEPNEVNAEYGLGYMLFRGPNETLFVWHGGSNVGWQANFFAVPSTGHAIVVLTNSHAGKARMEILGLWREAMFRSLSEAAGAKEPR